MLLFSENHSKYCAKCTQFRICVRGFNAISRVFDENTDSNDMLKNTPINKSNCLKENAHH